MTTGFSIFGETEGDLAGWSVSGAGDVNNDTMQDIVIGAPSARGVGAVYVIYGKRSMADVYLNNLTSSQGFALYGAQKSDYLGISASNAGDVNKDGCDDIVMGMVGTAAYFAGAAYIVYGGRQVQSFSLLHLDTTQGYKLSGIGYMYAGYSVSAAGDVNKDGYADVLIGSNPLKSSVPFSSYVIFGSSQLHTSMALSALTAAQGFRIDGGGTFVSGMGDINGDLYSDLIVSSNVGYSDTGGYIVNTNPVYLTLQSKKPSKAPTVPPATRSSLNPSRAPTLLPSVGPSLKPTTMPSVVPTSHAPIKGTFEPSISPSMEPTAPTSRPSASPTERTQRPSVQPSEPPTVAPSVEPSEKPSVSPSLISTQAPSVKVTRTPTQEPTSKAPTESDFTRRPVGVPTMVPSLSLAPQPLLQKIIDGSGGFYNDTGIVANQRYVINGTGIVNIIASEGVNTYVVAPSTNLTVTVWNFNASWDVIDVSQFSDVATLSDLTITAGSVIVTMPSGQVITLKNLMPSDVSEKNFLFSEAKDEVNKAANFILKMLKIFLPIGGGLIAGYLSYVGYEWFREHVKLFAGESKLCFVYHLKPNGDDPDPEDEDEASVEVDIESNNGNSEINKKSKNNNKQEDSISSTLSSFVVSDETVEISAGLEQQEGNNNNQNNQKGYVMDALEMQQLLLQIENNQLLVSRRQYEPEVILQEVPATTNNGVYDEVDAMSDLSDQTINSDGDFVPRTTAIVRRNALGDLNKVTTVVAETTIEIEKKKEEVVNSVLPQGESDSDNSTPMASNHADDSSDGDDDEGSGLLSDVSEDSAAEGENLDNSNDEEDDDDSEISDD